MNSFRTHRGQCLIDTDVRALCLTSPAGGKLRRYREGGWHYFVTFVVGKLFLAGWVIVSLYQQWEAGDYELLAGLFGSILVISLVLMSVQRVRNAFPDSTIPLDAITGVERRSYGVWSTPKYVVNYEVAGRDLSQSIRLPSGYLPYSDEEATKAEKLFRRRGLSITG